MSLGDVALACATALVDALVEAGVAHACLSPGSRSTPLALACARDDRVTVHVHLDERSSAFFALGLAKSLGTPVAVACTSGTAAAELFPAVVEASQSRIPLILLTADRPPRLRGTGANQTIDQVELFGRYARAYAELPLPSEPVAAARIHEILAEALAAAVRPKGPVHINVPFDEPLLPAGDPVEIDHSIPAQVRRSSAPERHPDTRALAAAITGSRGVFVLGGDPGSDAGAADTPLLQQRWPFVAEPNSQWRLPGQALAAGQALADSTNWLGGHRPEVVVQLGATPTTRATQSLLAAAERVIVVDARHLDPDPDGRATMRIHADPGELEIPRIEEAPQEWLDDWRLADTLARRIIDDHLDRSEAPAELQVARDVAAAVPSGGTLFVGNSLPIRDLDYAMAPRNGLRVLANRGASGIDGLVSTAMGIAASGRGPTVALLGDLSFLHDAGALLWNGRRGPNLTVVVPNNGGGQIFASLGQRALPPDELTALFTTPHGVDLGALCVAAGAGHSRVEEAWAFAPALEHAIASDGVQVVEVMTDPERSRAQRVQIQDAVDAALSKLA
jgi:2-succinyl-5-enolpyruvyl-6-hydroxy-3-cyclohexene-1-carboxylate synthase